MISTKKLTKDKIVSLAYHDIFDYPLTKEDLDRWRVGKKFAVIKRPPPTEEKDGYYFLKRGGGNVKRRLAKEKTSSGKLKILEGHKKFFSLVPSIKFVGITGSLAMNSASSASDIDLILITKTRTMWSSRFLLLLLLKIFSVPVRRAGIKKKKDMLCLNMWFDESDLIWPKSERNIFTAHEIAQIVPLINKDFSYERLISKNGWIFDYWPASVEVEKSEIKTKKKLNGGFIEKLMYWSQKLYMKGKITYERVTPTRAFFHPRNLSEEVLLKLRKKLE